MTAGATGTVLTNPLWVVKTRFMVSRAQVTPTCRHRLCLRLRLCPPLRPLRPLLHPHLRPHLHPQLRRLLRLHRRCPPPLPRIFPVLLLPPSSSFLYLHLHLHPYLLLPSRPAFSLEEADHRHGVTASRCHGVTAHPTSPSRANSPSLSRRFQAQAVLPASASRYRNTPEAFLSIYRTEGLRAFYKGLLPSLIGVSHVAVQFPLYEKAKSWAGACGLSSISFPFRGDLYPHLRSRASARTSGPPVASSARDRTPQCCFRAWRSDPTYSVLWRVESSCRAVARGKLAADQLLVQIAAKAELATTPPSPPGRSSCAAPSPRWWPHSPLTHTKSFVRDFKSVVHLHPPLLPLLRLLPTEVAVALRYAPPPLPLLRPWLPPSPSILPS